ncbi:MAG: hypothetical protein FWE22_03585 [Firmicutes bacterium]|nr:hypothetical protein [Bacillota bacterium]
MKKSICKNCTHYSSYYKKWSSHFSRLNNGFCSKHQKQQIQFENCEDFKDNEKKEKMREKRLFTHLEHALESINCISQILKEKVDDSTLEED